MLYQINFFKYHIIFSKVILLDFNLRILQVESQSSDSTAYLFGKKVAYTFRSQIND